MPDKIWTIKSILESIEGYLTSHGDSNPRLSSQWLVSEALGISRLELYINLDRPISEEEKDILREWMLRRAKGEPLQYIVGTCQFRSLSIDIEHDVLIPRPETEILVSEALKFLKKPPKPQEIKEEKLIRFFASESDEYKEALKDYESFNYRNNYLVADICTGSGCIACSIAKENPLTSIIATDISDKAIDCANKNIKKFQLDNSIKLIKSDLGESIDKKYIGNIDLIVSNPPYVPSSVIQILDKEVSNYEPILALDGGKDGLDHFKRLIKWAKIALKPKGCFICELHETKLDDAAEIAIRDGFIEIKIIKDLANKPRILKAINP